MPFQQVDWWQIKNAPPFSGGNFDNYPSTGPYSGPTLFFVNDDGLTVDSFLHVHTLLASLIQQGVIGIVGNQQMIGNWFLCPDSSSGPIAPYTPPNTWLTLQDLNLAFYDSGEGAITGPRAEIDYTAGNLTINSEGNLAITGGTTPLSTVSIENVNATQSLVMDAIGIDDTTLTGLLNVYLQAAPGATALWAHPTSGDPVWDVGNSGGLGYFSVNRPTGFPLLGVYGSDGIGNTFSGGICTTVGGSLSVPWSDITGTPTTLGGYGITDAVAIGSAAGGDLGGTFPNPDLAKIQGVPVIITGLISGEILQYNGSDWVNVLPGGSVLAIGDSITGSTPGDILTVDSSGNLSQAPGPQVIGTVSVDGLQGNSSGTLGFSVPVGFYRVSGTILVTATGTDTLAPSDTWGLSTVGGTSVNTSVIYATGYWYDTPIIQSVGNITWNVTSSGGSLGTYSVRLTLEQLFL